MSWLLRLTITITMTDLRPTFPLQCLDIRQAPYMAEPCFVAVLNGSSSPSQQPTFSLGNDCPDVVVDEQGRWGSHEWSTLPQLYDPASPWLSFIPIYRDSGHISRSTIHKTMMVQKEKEKSAMWVDKEPVMFVLESKEKEKMGEYVRGVSLEAENSLQLMRQAVNIEGDVLIVWPTEALARATFLSRLLVTGVPSRNSFKRALTSLRRAVLELEGFCIWTTLISAQARNRPQISSVLKAEKGIIYRGAFLGGTSEEWMDEGSELRCIYARLAQCNVPVYTLLRQADWKMGVKKSLHAEGGPVMPSAPMRGTRALPKFTQQTNKIAQNERSANCGSTVTRRRLQELISSAHREA